jgi:membrane dipeptidase
MSSHTGVQSVCDSFERNLSDDEIKAIAKSGGVVGIAFFAPAMCGSDILESILDSIM